MMPLRFSRRHVQLHRYGIATELRLNLLDDVLRISTGSVKLVDESQTRNLVSLHLAINGQRLSLNSTDRAKYENSTVENAQTAFDFDRKVHVTGVSIKLMK